MTNSNNNNASGVNANPKPAKPKKEKIMTPSLFIKETVKFLKEKPDTIKLREYVKASSPFILKFDFGHKIFDQNLDDKETLKQLCEKFYEVINEVNDNKILESEKKAEEKQKKSGVLASIFVQVWDRKKREYLDDYDIVITFDDKGKEKKMVESFATEHEAARWAANKLSTMIPGFRHKAVITDMRGEKTYTREMSYDEADKLKSISFKGTQVMRVNGTNVPNKPQMKVNASKQSFSRG